MCKKIDNRVIEGDDGDAGPLGPARGKIGSPRLRRTSVRVRASILAWFNIDRFDLRPRTTAGGSRLARSRESLLLDIRLSNFE